MQDAQNVDEQVDDVQIQVDCCQDVFFWRQSLHQQLCVEDDEQAKDKSAAQRQHNLKYRRLNEYLHESSNNQNQQSGKQTETQTAQIK